MADEHAPEVARALADAVEADDTDRVREEFATLVDIYDAGRQAYVRSTERANLAQQARDGGRTQPELRKLVRSAMAIPAARSGVILQTRAYLTDPEAVDRAQVADRARSLAERESEHLAATEAADPVVGESSLPASLVVAGIELPAEPTPGAVPVAVTVTNVGDERATAVTATVDAEELTVDPTERQVGTLDGGEYATVEFSVTATQTGQYRAIVTLSSPNARTDVEEILIGISSDDGDGSGDGSGDSDGTGGDGSDGGSDGAGGDGGGDDGGGETTLPDWAPIAGGGVAVGTVAALYAYFRGDDEEASAERDTPPPEDGTESAGAKERDADGTHPVEAAESEIEDGERLSNPDQAVEAIGCGDIPDDEAHDTGDDILDKDTDREGDK